MIDDVSTIRERGAAVHEAGVALRRATTGERAAWLAASARLLAQEARRESAALARSTGLSVPMVDWALQTTLRSIEESGLRSLAARAGLPEATPIAMLSVLLAGNVFTAPVRALVVPLLLGVPVLVKSSSHETLFPMMLRDALRLTAPHLGAALDVVAFEGGDLEREAALIAPAEVVAVYGGDSTVASVKTRSFGKALIAHGHGVSAAYCGRAALGEQRITATISGLSLDVCAYDQRGCLSPQVIYVEAAPDCPPEAFAERLGAEGFEPMSRTLPRGPLPLGVGAAQAQWRGAAEVEATLLQGDSYAICVRRSGPLRWSPGYRNVTVMPVEGPADAFRLIEPFAASLKCLGTDDASCPEVEARLARSPALHAYACSLGQMQAPPLDAPADGKPVWHGLLRSQTPMKRR
jgi:acyl-CoA reductase-like NAD-dependent aldehyde dehydrogenase